MSEVCWASDGEEYRPDFCSDVYEKEVGDIIYKAVAVKPDALQFIDADDILEFMSERASDEYGEWADWLAALRVLWN